MFGTENLAKIVQEHGFEDISKCMISIIHPGGRKLTVMYSRISVGFCTDGVNPFKHNNVAYSVANHVYFAESTS